jgi:hypothetical protein
LARSVARPLTEPVHEAAVTGPGPRPRSATAIGKRPASLVLGLRHGAAAQTVARRELCRHCRRNGVPAGLMNKAAFLLRELMLVSARQCGRSRFELQLLVGDDSIGIRLTDAATGRSALGSPGSERSWMVIRRLACSWGVADTCAGRELWALARK